jgi:hypothetical protein
MLSVDLTWQLLSRFEIYYLQCALCWQRNVKTAGGELCSLMKLCVLKYYYAICMNIGIWTLIVYKWLWSVHQILLGNVVRRYKICSGEESGISQPPGLCRPEHPARLHQGRPILLQEHKYQTLIFNSSISFSCSVSIELLGCQLKQLHFPCEYNKEHPLVSAGTCTNNIWNRWTLLLSVNGINIIASAATVQWRKVTSSPVNTWLPFCSVLPCA